MNAFARFSAIGSFPLAIYALWGFVPKQYDFKDPKGVNAATFVVDSFIEPIVGYANGISGTITFDPAKPEDTRGKIVIDAKSVRVTHATMTEHLHSPNWLDVQRFPTIEFEIKQIRNLRKTATSAAVLEEPEIRADIYHAEVVGDFTCKGITKQITVPVTLTHLPRMLQRRSRNMEGDLVVVRTEFKIDRRDFGIHGGVPLIQVGPEVTIRVSIVGVAPTS